MQNRFKKKVERNCIAYLLDSNNDGITNPVHIAHKFEEFYSALYNIGSETPINAPMDAQIKGFMASLNLPKLGPISHF